VYVGEGCQCVGERCQYVLDRCEGVCGYCHGNGGDVSVKGAPYLEPLDMVTT